MHITLQLPVERCSREYHASHRTAERYVLASQTTAKFFTVTPTASAMSLLDTLCFAWVYAFKIGSALQAICWAQG